MNKKHPKSKRKGGKGIRLCFLVLGVLLLVFCLSFFIYAKTAVSPEMDEALFRTAGADNVTRFYYCREPGNEASFVEWEDERLVAGEMCIRTALADTPLHLQNAFIAMEDHRFYSHGGVDVLRTGAAALYRIFRGKGGFGGSTITQQLIKNIGGEKERTVSRKVKEMLRAIALEGRHSKEEILEAYLNIVPLGAGCVGVGAASRTYFDKEPDALSLSEAASLAAITRAPARLSPHTHPEEHKARRDLVLSRMAELGYITEEECREAQAMPLSLAMEKEDEKTVRSWYAERVLYEVERDLCKKGYTESAAWALIFGGGLQIYTALDPAAQQAAEEAFVKNDLKKTYGEGFHAACALFSPESGRLIALVGDLGEKRAERIFSYATDMRRAPGSVLKPLSLYAPAVEEGRITAATLFDDVPKSFHGNVAWPKNATLRYDGLILAHEALASSKNTVAVELYRMLGAEHIYATLTEKFSLSGIVRSVTDAKGEKHTDLAEAPLALGQLTYGESLFTLTRAYLPFAAEGQMSEGMTYIRVVDAGGNVLLDAEDETRAVLSNETASVLTQMLRSVVEEGSASSLSLSALVDTAGKTGSSGENRDRWFIGYTPYYLCGVWCGYENGNTAVGGTPHLSLFDRVMCPLHETLPDDGARSFRVARGLVARTVCRDSGKLLTDSCHLDERGDRSITVWVPKETPLEKCDTHVTVLYDREGDGVAYPPFKGNEGTLERVALIRVPWRSFPVEVQITDAEYVYRDAAGTVPPEGDVPFFAGAITEGVYIGKSHNGRPFHAATKNRFSIPKVQAPLPEKQEEKKETLPKRTLPSLPKPRLPRFPFFSRR